MRGISHLPPRDSLQEISIASLLAETGRPKTGTFYPLIPAFRRCRSEHEIQAEKAADRIQSKNSAELVLVRCVTLINCGFIP
jgi:hypothetical protein